MNEKQIQNFIESQHRELLNGDAPNEEFAPLYSDVKNPKMREILFTLHFTLTSLYRTMNQRLPTNDTGNHFWADPSRELIKAIEMVFLLYNTLKNTPFAFEIDSYYEQLMLKCRDFLSPYQGTTLPTHMEKVTLYYTMPIFKPYSTVTIDNTSGNFSFPLTLIGEGSYAHVYKYKDTFYNKFYILKRAKKNLNDKELIRFKREFDEMDSLLSPYIVEVFSYNQTRNEYIMEFMDYTLYDLISKNNATIPVEFRKNIISQTLRAFDYIHSKGRLHRDISPMNILIKEYDDVSVVKVADFGLVKTPDSTLTSASTEFKGWFNDPILHTEGFDNYAMQHETYALTRIVYYVLTGKRNTSSIKDERIKKFVDKGLNADLSQRYQDVNEISKAFKAMFQK